MAEFLLEIGCEELPAPWLGRLAADLGESFEALARRERLLEERGAGLGTLEPPSVAKAKVLWTPRRLLLAAQLLPAQLPSNAQFWGPSEKAARDAAGNWTRAAEGFAKKHGVEPGRLTFGVKAGTERHVLVEKALPEKPAASVLPGLIGETLRSLAFPKRMNWDAWLDDGKGAFPFGRPIRWLVALLDGAVLPFTIHGAENGQKGSALVESGGVTRGHRFLPRGAAGGPIPVRSFDDLKEKLRAAFVLRGSRGAGGSRSRRARPRRERPRISTATGSSRSGAISSSSRRWSWGRSPRSSSRCRPKSSRPCSSTIKNTSRLRPTGGRRRCDSPP